MLDRRTSAIDQRRSSNGRAVNCFIYACRLTTVIIPAMIATATNLLITALQKSARMGSIGRNGGFGRRQSLKVVEPP